jgi:hypothetical protein
MARLRHDKMSQTAKEGRRGWERVKRWVKGLYPWIIIILLLYHLLRFKINGFYMLMEKSKSKALSIAASITKENSLDLKFFLFSQFMRILFSIG